MPGANDHPPDMKPLVKMEPDPELVNSRLGE
jgi:hypothetical protein